MKLDSYADAGVFVAIELVNQLRVASAEDPMTALAQILAVDPPSVARLKAKHVRGFEQLADELHTVFIDFAAEDMDSAAERLNALLSANPAHPHLAKERGRWRMHHHPSTAALVEMWNSICAEALGRLISAGHTNRLGVCADAGCGRVYVDTSRNGSRRFCSTTCQNRVKTAAFRRRKGEQ